MDLPVEVLAKVSPGVEGLAFVEDPDLGVIPTPNGKLTFVNVLPLAPREWWLLGAWDFDKYVGEVRQQQGDLLWRVGRDSVLNGARGTRIENRVREEGSSQSVDFCEVRWDERGFLLDDASRRVFIKFLRHRISFARDATIIAGTRKVLLFPGTEWKTECSDNLCEIQVPAADATVFADKLEEAEDGAVFEKPGGTAFRVTAGILSVQSRGAAEP